MFRIPYDLSAIGSSITASAYGTITQNIYAELPNNASDRALGFYGRVPDQSGTGTLSIAFDGSFEDPSASITGQAWTTLGQIPAISAASSSRMAFMASSLSHQVVPPYTRASLVCRSTASGTVSFNNIDLALLLLR